ncbi:MAG: hypothetical protein J5626_00475 [Lachnospiraceae bacterium]|nr:hypothetical protein [Lachnospiraceae bacterium]
MSVYLFTLFVSLFRTFEEKAGKRIIVFGVKLSYISGVFFVIITAFLIWLIFFLKSKLEVKKYKYSGVVFTSVYWLLFAFLFSYGFYVRLSGLGVLKKWETIKHYTESVSKPGYWQTLLDLFYGKPVTFDNFFHKVYTYVAALLLRIFGDTLTVPAVLNAILYMVSAVLLFFSVKFIFGRVPAIAVFAALTLTKAPISFLFEISGFNMFFFALSILLFLVTYMLDVFTTSKPVMCYIISGITLIVAILFNHFTFKPFEPVFAFDLSILKFRPSEIIGVSIAIAVFAFIGYYSFLKAREDEISFANILLVVLLLILMFDYSANNTYLFVIVSFCILAGIGADNLLFKNYKEVYVTAEESDEEILPRDMEDDIPVPEPVPVPVRVAEPVREIEINIPEVASEPAKEEPEGRKVPAFFDTPIPMPKKHVRKTFDYAFEPVGNMMKYDVEISPDDDFDIK